ncbi:MAG: P-loop NTPase [Clostridia bacterium]|nr:P-loop NTPase [Clostridia bacterium]
MDAHKLKDTPVILFTSCKGGVGKSTVCANLAMAIARRGKRVLLIDCDFGNRCLDLITGMSDDVVYDISDIAFGRIPMERAILKDRRTENLFFIAAPYSFENSMNAFAFKAVVKRLVCSASYDFIFIDTPGGIGDPLTLAADVADTAYIIAEPTRAAVRAADRTSEFLATRGVKRRRLIINKLSGTSVDKAKQEAISIIDTTSLRLIGIVPYDPEMIAAGNKGALVDEMISRNVTSAFDNIAARTLGEGRKLFDGIRRLRKLR